MPHLQNMYIITGAAGFLGNNLVLLINEKDPRARVVAMCLPGEDARSLEELPCEIRRGDVTRPETLRVALDPGDFSGDSVSIIHCAGVIDISSRPNPALQAVNVGGTGNVIAAARELTSRRPDLNVRMMYVGSVHAIPEKPKGETMSETDAFDPNLVDGQYAKSKAAASRLVLDAARADLDAVILEPSGIIGPRNYSPENMKELVRKVAAGKLRVCVPGGYNFVDVRDVAAGVLAACDRGRRAQSYILSGSYTSMLDLCNTVCRMAGRKPIKFVIPLWLAALVAPVCELVYRARKQIPLFTSYSVHTVDVNAAFSNAKAARELGYTARPLTETLRDMLAWMGEEPS